MCKGYTYRRRSPATPDQLSQLLHEQPGTPAWRLQEEMDALEFELAGDHWLATLPASLWSQGRVFGPRAEVRWWITGSGSYNILILSEAPLELPPNDWQDLLMEAGGIYNLSLWGERKHNDPYWIETRIPRPLRYPLGEAEWQRHPLPYVVVEARDYAQNGIVRLTRLVRLLAAVAPPQGGSHG